MKKAITITTIALFAIGGTSLVLIGYSYMTAYHGISKERAVAIAMRDGGFTNLGIGSINIDAKLLQAKLSNHIALPINYPTMSLFPFPVPVPLRPLDVQDNQLFWEITIDSQVRPMVFKQWTYEIDASNGTIIQRFSPEYIQK